MRRIELLPTPSGIGPGQTATVNLPLGPTYFKFMFEGVLNENGTKTPVTGQKWADCLDEIRLNVNGETKIELTAKDLLAFNKFHGVPDSKGILSLFLSQPWARTLGGEDNTAYGTAQGVASFTIEADIKQDVNFDYLRLNAVQGAPQPFGSHLRIQRFSNQMGLEGVKEISDIPRGPYNMLGMHFTTDQIDRVEILADNQRVHNSSKLIRNAHQKVAGRVPQVGYTHLCFVPENRMTESLPMILNDFRTKLDFTQGNQTFKIYTFSIQGLLNGG